jgi:hypothetical protein
MTTPEAPECQHIDELLAAGWAVQSLGAWDADVCEQAAWSGVKFG